ncbi:hypothetical protein [Litoreibacter roseus]|uniref:Response regulatory domain-containing protein n=1 Tax=Litoreibacter roseus TaxID=2601869 RepID=A0A6N6JLG0_9RHOB|nr:hypothetical protein [Litoreibacter roseus]GFE66108.1 hypothetical protein KIN_31820 [Litoreibacter roseus]
MEKMFARQGTVQQFLIVEPDPIVSLDLSEIISDWVKDPAIEVVHHAEEAREILMRIPALAVAFINIPFEEYNASGLYKLVSEKGGRTISTYPSDAETATADVVQIHRPFSSDMITKALSEVGVSQR